MIRFIIKSLIVISIILVAFSFISPSKQNKSTLTQQSPSMIDTLYAAKNVLGDLGGFCTRNHASCETVKSYFVNFVVRVKEGAMLAYKYIFESIGNSMQNSQNLPKTLPAIISTDYC